MVPSRVHNARNLNPKLQFPNFKNNKKAFEHWLPVDMYVGGTEHATRHLIYARFWHKFLYDIGIVGNKEPFARPKKSRFDYGKRRQKNEQEVGECRESG